MILDVNFDLDVKRSIILAEYIKCWGMPESRNFMPSKSMPVEIYVFPGEDMDQVTRVVTIGLSSCKFADGKSCNNELLMVLPYDIAEDQEEIVSKYVFEISNYIINGLSRSINTEDLREESKQAPEGWPKAILFDDPRGEPNELNQFYIGLQHVKLSWVIPIFNSELELIKNSGIESFDAAIENAEVSLVEVRRDPSI